ncbi:MAG: hypothetical protein KJ064_18055 [Anaerolineae bacterium]|nr:hypothetical protein [Anaerolineae bacterium]
MISYTGNGAYCYANSLHMCLKAAGMTPLPEPGFLECLTLMPFGNFYIRDEEKPMYFPGGASTEPDSGLSIALKTLGWAADETWGGSAEEALAQLREAVQSSSVLVGPIDMAYLTYNPNYHFLNGEDHFVVVLEVQETEVLLHDPQQYPFAPLALEKFMKSWQVETVSRQEMISRTLEAAKTNLKMNLSGPKFYNSIEALQHFAEDLHGGCGEKMRDMLVYFSLPLGARRSLDAAAFFLEAGFPEAATLLEHKAMLYGRAQQHAVDRCFNEIAEVVQNMAKNEEMLIAVL